ncbi:hypothetical protein KA005_78970 [bacterium]|nr:hypothetical protein [bacterium]
MAIVSFECRYCKGTGSVISGIFSNPHNYYNGLSEADAELLRFCECSSPESRTITNHDFEDEMRSLQLTTDEKDMQYIIETRFSDVDQVNIDTLLNDENY